MKGLMMDCQLLIPSILERAESLTGHKEIISRLPDKSIHRYNYKALAGRSRKLSRALQKLGIKEGDRVATFCWNHYQHLEAYFAIPATGAVIHTLNIRLSAEDLAFVINQASDKILIVDQVLLPVFEKFRADISPEKIIVIRQSDEPVCEDYLIYEEVLEWADSEIFQPFNGDENTAAMLCYTSGTTGKPKGVLYSHRSVVLNAMTLLLSCSGIGITENDVVLPVVPMFHAAAWGLPFSCAFSGASLALPGPYSDAPDLLELIAEHKVTITGGVPTVFVTMLHYLNEHQERYKLVLRQIIVGGSAAPKYLIKDFQEKHAVSVLHSWGMTELSPLGSTAPVTTEIKAKNKDLQLEYAGKQGQPVPFLKVRGKTEHGWIPWDGQSPGELEVRGPCVASGYYLADEPSESFTDDGWFKTGDIAVIHPNGFIELKDRTKDIIKSGGEWISSITLENTLMSHPSVSDAAVIGIPDTKWIERPCAYLVLKEGHKVSAVEFREFLKDKVAKFWIPEEYHFIESMPKTSVGKTMKSALRSKYLEEDNV